MLCFPEPQRSYFQYFAFDSCGYTLSLRLERGTWQNGPSAQLASLLHLHCLH